MKRNECKEKVAILKEIVERNKLRNNGVNIDSMVIFLKQKGIKITHTYEEDED